MQTIKDIYENHPVFKTITAMAVFIAMGWGANDFVFKTIGNQVRIEKVEKTRLLSIESKYNDLKIAHSNLEDKLESASQEYEKACKKKIEDLIESYKERHENACIECRSALIVEYPKRYRYVMNELDYNVRVYGDRPYKYTEIPNELLHQDYIITMNDDKFTQGNDLIKMHALKDLTLFVAHDERLVTKPSWLNNFQKTNQKMEYRVSGQLVILRLYKKHVTANEELRLGGNVAHGDKNENSMYTIAIVPDH